jgi:tetratricopeptide (TPR) repeat protein
MKLLILAVISAAIGFCQGNDCDSLEKCREILKTSRNSSLAHFRIGEIYFRQGSYQDAANEFREVLSGDRDPKWTEVWTHINLGRIYDLTDERERAINEYRLVLKINDNSGGAVDEATEYIKVPYKRN